MSNPNTLKQEPANVDDIPALTDLWFAAFTDPVLRRLWPDTPGVRKWWDEANRHDMLNKPFQRYIKIIDPSSSSSSTYEGQGDGKKATPRIIAYAKWDLAMPEERGRRYPPWHGDMPEHECDMFFEREENERRRVMGNRRHYCMMIHPCFLRSGRYLPLTMTTTYIDLDTLATHPDYQRRGAGSMLLKWGCELADRHGVALYVDASKAGAPLYERFGFVDEGELGNGKVASMVRW